MKLPNWFKILWWILLLIGLSVFLLKRYSDLIVGKPTGLDMLVLVVWLALLLLPLFQEVSLFGLTFKKEFEALKTNVKEEVASIRAEIRNSVDIQTQISPSIVLPPSPPDSQLPAIKKEIQAALEEALSKRNLSSATVFEEVLVTPPDTEILFRARYNIERELRRIWLLYSQQPADRRFLPTLRIAQSLAEWNVIDRGVEGAIREVWLVASPAIHGQPVTQAKVDFVKGVAPKLVATLKSINP
jgi:hypothetical protein